ncbi:hypothetical protein [Limnobacter sp.]|uniref:hypothetical protein n=1 Tax=Limnobacter sp. TaxID=2003368 RepID=UPI002FDF92D8
MALPVQYSNAATWHTLGELAASENVQSANHGGDPLPPIAPGGKVWSTFKTDTSQHTPHIAQLNQSVKGIHQFIASHAKQGAEQQKALSNLQHYLNTKVNCQPGNLSALTINENRRNLYVFAQQLNNPAIATDQKLVAALDLGKGLGVCTEGETLNILDSTQQLCNRQQGLVGLLVHTKNQLIDQYLQQLVKHEDGMHLPNKLANDLEIHHVQALKNHVAGQWGLAVREDRYATSGYQAQAGEMASALLAQTITPAALANNVAEQLGQALISQTAPGLREGIPAAALKTEPLRRAIQAEFGQSIDLEQCLEFNDDYTEVRLKPQENLALHIMKAFQDIGLVPPHANPKHVLNQPTPSLQQAIERVGKLRGEVAHQPLRNHHINSFWFGHTLTPQDSKEKNRRNHPSRHH